MSILSTYAPATTTSAARSQPGLFARFMSAMYEARMRKALRMLDEHRHLIADLGDDRFGKTGR